MSKDIIDVIRRLSVEAADIKISPSEITGELVREVQNAHPSALFDITHASTELRTFAYLGASVAEIFAAHSKLETLEITVSVESEYDDEGGTYRSFSQHTAVSCSDPEVNDDVHAFIDGRMDNEDLGDWHAALLEVGTRYADHEWGDVKLEVRRDQIADLLQTPGASALEVYRRIVKPDSLKHLEHSIRVIERAQKAFAPLLAAAAADTEVAA